MQAESPNRVPWPPLIYLAGAGAGFALHLMMPLPWAGGPLETVLFWLGLALMAAAAAVDILCFATFRRHRTTILPHRGASHLITTGPFAWSRNPIYTGNTALLLGAGLALGIVWLGIMAFVAAAITLQLAIRREERHLERKFGEAWRRYAQRVPRWLL
jgi:protein-S-isoprenylcysteine O-methyltransferase Ste14